MAVKIFLALVAVAAAMVLQSSAATYRVGDNFGWNTPTGGFSFSNWAAQHTFGLDDILVFEFNTGVHTAARVNENDYTNCNTRGNPLSLQTNGPANFTLNQLGPWYFICTVSNHCLSGQKLLVNVTSAVGPTGSPQSSPTTPSGANSSHSPPPPNSATMPTSTVALWMLSIIALAFIF